MKSMWKQGVALVVLIGAGTAQGVAGTSMTVAGGATFTPVQPETFSIPGSYSNAWADFDRDGDLDFAVSIKGGELRLYRNDKGMFVNVAKEKGIPKIAQEVRGLAWADLDGDGWLDLYAGAATPADASTFLHNNGGKRFIDMTVPMGLGLPGRSSRQNNFVDYDNDGDLDLFVTDRIGKNRLFRNDEGKLVQAFVDSGPTVFTSTVGACWFDFDKDGDLDLFVANQSGKADALWRNDGGTGFTDVAPALHIDHPGRTKEEGGVGCAIGDYDSDGNLDIFVPNYGRNTLWHNNGDGTFADASAATGVDIENHAVGAAWGDYDNDGYPDLAIMSYHGERGAQQPADSIFHNESDGKGGRRFVNIAPEGTMLSAGDHGVEWIDYNKDGALDLSMTRGYSPVGGHYLFRSSLPTAVAQRSLSVLVLDAKGHFTQAGAEVRLFDAAGKVLGAGMVPTGGGYGVQSALPVRFGLASMQKVTVEVTFMSAGGRKVQKVAGIDPRRYAGQDLVVKRK